MESSKPSTNARWDAAWTPSTKLALSFLLGAALSLLVVHVFTGTRWTARPSEARQAIDINRADRKDLLQIPGIGPTLAERIVEHRNRVGGYRDVDELLGVPGVGPSTLETLKTHVAVIDGASVAEPERLATGKPTAKMVDLNRATANELERLPGIGPKLAQRIVEERRKAPYQTVDELRRVPGIGAKIIEKLRSHVLTEAVIPANMD